MANIFQTVPVTTPKRNTFDLSHEVKTSCNFGQLVPFYLEEVLPCDKFRVSTEMLLRFAPMLAPIMHRVDVFTHFFYVPNRLVWSEWEDFITGGEDGRAAPPLPTLSVSDTLSYESLRGTLFDYFGLPINNPISSVERFSVNALPFRAYSLIWNEYYRDQNLQEEISIDEDVSGEVEVRGISDVDYFKLRYRCWQKDYFTSALPWTQRGGNVSVPIHGTALVENNYRSATPGAFYPAEAGNSVYGEMAFPRSNDGTHYNAMGHDNKGIPSIPMVYDPQGTLSASMSDGSIDIQELRRANALQRYLERSAVVGSRYTEYLRGMWGVTPDDIRLMRPQFLGGGRAPVSISEVLQTSETGETAQGSMAGHGVSASVSHAFKGFFKEHGFIIGILSVMPKPSYQNGLSRFWSRRDKFDYANQYFAHLGEQGILNKEIFATGTPSDDEVFGYTPRYSEYRYHPSTVHGDFRTDLDYWHLGRSFDSAPGLNSDFVSCDDPNLNRIFNVVNDPSRPNGLHHIWIQLYNKVRAVRPLPKFGIPSL